MARPSCGPGLLGDTPARDYALKLSLFNAFARRELQQAVASLSLQPGMRVLDAGCGTGEALEWLANGVNPTGLVIGLDLAAAHVRRARLVAPVDALVLQANVNVPPLRNGTIDLLWCVNTINHLRDPRAGVEILKRLLRPGGRIAVGQSSFVPDMLFAWNAPFERRVNDAVRHYYRDRYDVSEPELAGIRSLVGLLRSADLRNVTSTTFVIERISPLSSADEEYLLDAIFRGTWGERLRPYLATADYEELVRLCDPADSQFALRRPDFHYIQSFTLVAGQLG
jgi:SAM-dependent methyltransferase